jgi:hypothetical protein
VVGPPLEPLVAAVNACRVCGDPIERVPGKKGRPPVTHPACKSNPKSHQRISPGVSEPVSTSGQASVPVVAQSPAVPQQPGRPSPHKFEASHLNPEWCKDCRQWSWEH